MLGAQVGCNASQPEPLSHSVEKVIRMRLLEMLSEIAIRPTMYLGDVTVERIDAFLLGWIFASDDRADWGFYMRFQAWVHSYYNDNTKEAWWELVKRRHTGEEESARECFKLLDEFCSIEVRRPDTTTP